MASYADLTLPENGQISRNILWFARALRKAMRREGRDLPSTKGVL